MDEFEAELKTGFLEEATQLLAESEQCFLELEKNPQDSSILEKIFRIAHNIKGSSKAVGFSELGAYTHEFESFLLKLKKGELEVSPEAVTLLLAGNDHLRAFIEALRGDLGASLDSSALIERFLSFNGASGGIDPGLALPLSTDAGFSEDLEEFAEVTTQALAAAPPAEAAAISENAPAALPPAANRPGNKTAVAADESIRVSLSRVERLVNLVGEAVILQTVLREQAMQGNGQQLRRTVHHLGKVTKEVQDLAMGLRMVPLKQTFQKMQRIVRDTSALLGKKVSLELDGEDTEVDKTVLESLSDPLVHMVRNAVDHGVENPEGRRAAGKPEEGRLVLRAFHQSGRLIIEVQDDGGGIDAERLKRKAEEKGILKDTSRLTEREAIHLVFHPGFSTKAEVTEVSGRGVGMDVVKTNIEALQGEVSVSTELGKGTRFRVSLPLTLAIIDGMIVQSGAERFVIPLSHVHESVRLNEADVRRTSTLGDVLLLRGENLPLYRLSTILGRRAAGASASDPGERGIAIIVRNQGQSFATLVDDIIGQHQVVIKKVGAELQGVKGFSGSAILGDGRPALILEIQDLISDRRAA